jgi:predicted nucleic acid-binding protein
MPKIVVDSSVWIDFFNKKFSLQIEHLEMLLLTGASGSPVIILPVIMQEVLQGIENDKFFITVKENLEGLDYLDYEPFEFAIKAAQLYRSLRRKGIAIKKLTIALLQLCVLNLISPYYIKTKTLIILQNILH